jgi:hypothetical protein
MKRLRQRFVLSFALLTSGCGLISGLDSLEEGRSVTDGGPGGGRDGSGEGGTLPDGAPIDGSAGGGDAASDAPAPRPDVDVPDGKALLFVTVSGAPGGRVTSSAPPPVIDCTTAGGTGCYAIFDAGDSVYLIAVEVDGGAKFDQWGGGCTASLTPDCYLMLDTSTDVSASFK